MAAIHIWRRVLGTIFGPLERSIEARRVRRSYTAPFVTGSGRDAFRYYEHGRSVTVYAEMHFGHFDRVIDQSGSLKWNDTHKELSEPEREKVYRFLFEHFGRHNIRWKDVSI